MKRLVGCLVLLVAANGCMTYRLVERTPEGGTYALLGDPASSMVEARPQMEAHCGGPVKVVKEGEVVVGETTQSKGTSKKKGSMTFGSATSETTQKTEWRVEYKCDEEEEVAAEPTAPERPVKTEEAATE